MKKILFIFILLLSSACMATIPDDILRVNNQARVSFSVLDLDYKETVEHGVTLDSENGTIPGVKIDISKTFGRLLINPSLAFYLGEETYRGSTWDGTPGVMTLQDDSSTFALKASLKAGYQLGIKEKALLTPYLHYGYRRWYRGGENGFPMAYRGGVIDINDYSEVYENQFLSGGLLFQMVIRSAMVAGVYASAGSTFSSKLSTNLPWGEDNIGTITSLADLGSKPIYQAGFNIDYRFDEHLHAFVGIDYEYFQFGKSKVDVVGTYEPDSRTIEWVASIGLAAELA